VKNLKDCLARILFTAFAMAPTLAGQSAPPPDPNFFPPPPRAVVALVRNESGTAIKTFPILPGQTLKVYDPYYDFIKIETVFPVTVHIGKCNSDSVTEFECRDVPGDSYITIYDSRVGISPDFSPRSPVKIIAVHHEPTPH
jgi:hypothetical protein